MTESIVRALDQVRSADLVEVGGKAAGLGELIAIGARVPAGIVLAAAAADLSAAERAEMVRQAIRGLGAGPFAVRSSGVVEDGAERSFAGLYESVLDVAPEDVPAAVERCLASTGGSRVAGYHGGSGERMAVIVQRMVRPSAAGVALTADPVTGDRRSCVVTAVAGLADRLVSGEALGDEWTARDGRAVARRRPERAIDGKTALRVAREAQRIAAGRGAPQDVEWAIDGTGALWIVQARPMTALPAEVSWEPPAPGAYTRQLRFGEWITEPVTPLFESWLLPAMEERLHAQLLEQIGQRAPLPHHVVVNGWYFYSLNWIAPRSMLRSLPGMLRRLVRSPRTFAALTPLTVRHSISTFERMWREEVLPAHRATVADAEAQVEALAPADLPQLIDRLADDAGEYFASIAVFAGAAYKMEMNLFLFYRRHVARSPEESHLPLLAGFESPIDAGHHAVTSLDWWHAPAPLPASPPSTADRDGVVGMRRHAEEEAFERLAGSPRRLRAFRELLAEAQRLVPIREEHVRELTLGWPVMRRAVLRIGEELAAHGAIASPEDVFFLTHAEALRMLSTADAPRVDVAARRALRDEQARLVPPLLVGRLDPLMRRLWDAFPKMVGARPSDRALVSGAPASAGRATGLVRIVRGSDEFDLLQPGEVLVAPTTAPAWTPLFARAAAVVTDVGSPAAHASIIAREYGIPAVVGCGDATARLRTGQCVLVDGNAGNVEPG